MQKKKHWKEKRKRYGNVKTLEDIHSLVQQDPFVSSCFFTLEAKLT